jgi:hypothetical protein
MTWVLTTTEKKSVEEYEFWTKDDVTIKRINGFRWGTVYCDNEDKPEIDLDNTDGISVFDCGYDFELDSLDDGWYCDWEFPDDMSEEERQAIIDGWDEDSYDYMESNGWYNSETETWFFGQLSLEEQ